MTKHDPLIHVNQESLSFIITTSSDKINMHRLGYVRSLHQGTETLCRDDIGDLPGSPEHL